MKRFVALCLVAVAFATAPAFAGWDEGVDAANKGDYKTALREFQPFAEQGDARAQFNLGLIYYNGKGVPQDYKEAVKWLSLSAEQGDVDAQFILGLMYKNGEGVPQDYKEAVKLYRLSAEQGHASAQSNLGLMYGNGYGVLQDIVLAHMWFNLSVSNGNELATGNRDDAAGLMTPAQLEKAQDLAKKCLANDYQGC